MKTRHWDRHGTGGLTVTELGMGTAPLGNLYRAISDDDAQATLQAAWDGGVRFYDTAPLYGLGLAETRLNRFLRGKDRDAYVLATKIGRLLDPCPPGQHTGVGKWFDVPDRQERFDYSHDGVMRSVEFSLERLGLSRIDILHVHDLCVFTHGSKAASDARIDAFFETGGYDAMRKLRDEGTIAAIGGGVNEWQVCQTLAERGDFDMFLLAGRYTLLEQDPLDTFLPLCAARGIKIITGGPYNSGILATGPIKGAWFNYDPAPDHILQKTRAIAAIFAAHKTRLVHAAFQFPLLHPTHLSVIPGGQSATETQSNLDAAAAEIPPDLWAELKSAGLMRADAPTG